jgi:hypothetical protein
MASDCEFFFGEGPLTMSHFLDHVQQDPAVIVV